MHESTNGNEKRVCDMEIKIIQLKAAQNVTHQKTQSDMNITYSKNTNTNRPCIGHKKGNTDSNNFIVRLG